MGDSQLWSQTQPGWILPVADFLSESQCPRPEKGITVELPQAVVQMKGSSVQGSINGNCFYFCFGYTRPVAGDSCPLSRQSDEE